MEWAEVAVCEICAALMPFNLVDRHEQWHGWLDGLAHQVDTHDHEPPIEPPLGCTCHLYRDDDGAMRLRLTFGEACPHHGRLLFVIPGGAP